MKNLMLMVIILLIALGLRIYQLDKVPIELYGDEIDVGLQGYSILHTGKDYFGNSFPTMFKSFGEHRLPFFIYSSVPFISVFGLSEWGVRLANVFWGILGIIGIYLLARKLFNPTVGLITAFLIAISPWHILYSRQAGIEALLLVTLVTWGTWAFLEGLSKYKFLILSGVLFSLSIYAYATAIVFVPLLVGALVLSNWTTVKKIKLSKIIIIMVLGLVLMIPYIRLYTSGQSAQRFSTISIWSDKSLEDEINRRRKIENSSTSPIFHNKPLTYLYEASGNYVRAYSLDFLFFKGDPNLRHSVGGMGMFYWFELFTILAGVVYLIQNKSRSGWLILIWLLIAPLPASLTRDGAYHASRLMLILPPFIILSASGLNFLYRFLSKGFKRPIFGLILIIALINITTYLHRFYTEWPYDSWRFWQYGFKETYQFLKSNDHRFDRVFVNNTYEAAFPRYLFWYEFNPITLQTNFDGTQNIKDITNGFEGFKYGDKYFFGTVTDMDQGKGISNLINENDIYVASYRNDAHLQDWTIKPPHDLKILKTIYDPTGEPIFYILTK